MRKLVPLLLLAIALGGDSGGAAAPDPAPAGVQTTVYMLAEGGAAPLGVRRGLPARSPLARAAIAALLAGPSAAERQRGLTTALPSSTRLLSLSFRGRSGEEAVVDLSRLDAVGDGLDRARLITQVVRTLVGVSGIERVWFSTEGRPWGLWTLEGEIHAGPYDYSDLAGFHLGSGCPGAEAVTCDRFDALP